MIMQMGSSVRCKVYGVMFDNNHPKTDDFMEITQKWLISEESPEKG